MLLHLHRKALIALVGLALGAVAVAACAPPPPTSGPRPYLDPTYSDIQVTPDAQPVVYGAAPPVDPNVGPSDPYHRAVDANGNQVLGLFVADPVDNTAEKRPAIVWVHGGGFKAGIGSAHSLLASTALPYAQRGYVSVSIEYRVDTTSDCQYVQDHGHDVPPPADLPAQLAKCQASILAAQHDTQAAVRWVRAHASELRVDPAKVAVGGFSAGAVTAANLAYRWDDPGTWAYWPGDDPSVGSRPQAAFGASGCSYDPAAIGAGDVPISLIHSEYDQAVDYRGCVAPTVTTARAAGLTAELTSYCAQGGHAIVLYQAHRAATDEQWTTFLARELHIYSGLRPPSADPVCP